MSKQRETNLIKLLKLQSKEVDCIVVKKPALNNYKNMPFYKELLDIYHKLGGVQNDIPFNIGDYDCIVDGFIVELDEENHFNRYRALTLEASIYKNSGVLDKSEYLLYCTKYESKCRKNGGFWRNDSSDRWFGKSDVPGSFTENGSSRWKQRAFYDLLKDCIPLILDISVRRISIYDRVLFGGRQFSVDEILKFGDAKFSSVIYESILKNK